MENVIRFRMVWRLAWARYHFDPPPPDGWFGEAVTRKLEIPGLNPGQTITVYIYITPLCSKQCSLHCCLYIYGTVHCKKTFKKSCARSMALIQIRGFLMSRYSHNTRYRKLFKSSFTHKDLLDCHNFD